MKNIVLTLLRTGATRTKKYTLEDLSKKYGFLSEIAQERKDIGLITTKTHSIWYDRELRNDVILKVMKNDEVKL